MIKSVFIFWIPLLICGSLLAQKNKSVTVKGGTAISDYFPIDERYLYSEFTKGKAVFTEGRIFPSVFNLNFLTGEIEFIRSNDTLIITDKTDLLLINIAQDTFYYHNGYLQLIQNGRFKTFVKRQIVINDILKKGAMGTINRSAASESYSYLISGPLSYDMVVDYDMVLQQEDHYFFSTPDKKFIRFTRNNISKLPDKTSKIKYYMMSNKPDFESREDILRLADYINLVYSRNL